MKKPHKNNSAIITIYLLISFIVPHYAVAQLVNTDDSQDGLRGAPQVNKNDARTTSLGNANIAEANNISSINLNPASLSFVRNLRVVQINVHQNWDNNLMLEYVTFPGFEYENHRVAAQFSYHHSGPDVTNLLGRSISEVPSLGMNQVDITYAYSIDNLISFGIFNSISFAQNEHAQFWSYFANLGALYSPSESISYGATLRGLGRSIIYEIHESGRTILGSQGLRQSLEIGATLHFPVDTDHTFLSLSLANEKRFGEDGIWYKGGVEVRPWEILALRTGILFHPEDQLNIPRFGVGLVQGTFKLDYMISYRNLPHERFHQLGLTIQL